MVTGVKARWPAAVSVREPKSPSGPTGRGKQAGSGFDLNVKRTAGGKGRTLGGGGGRGSEPRRDTAAGGEGWGWGWGLSLTSSCRPQ